MKAISHHLLALLLAFTVHLHAAVPAGKTQKMTSPDQVPDGLAKSDWSSIRAAYEAGRHAFQPVEGGWQARNPGQQWLTKFDGRGFVVEPAGGGWQWGLQLESYGFAGQERSVSGQPQVKADGQRLTYQWDASMEEWFVNDPRGLEHGYIVKERPASFGSGTAPALSFLLIIRGNLKPVITTDAQGVLFQDASGATVLNYTGLKVWDAEGKTLRTHFEAANENRVHLLVDERTARYPITIDPIAQQAYLKASNTGDGDGFGSSVAVSGDTVVVGAPDEDSSASGVGGNQADNFASKSGAAYVFVRNGPTWSQQAYLKASQVTANDNFGDSVAVSGDTLVVGAPDEDGSATGVNGIVNEGVRDAGAAYVFVRSGTTWSQQAYLKASQVSGDDNFGVSVAVAGDTVVVGSPYEDGSATGVNGTVTEGVPDAGAAYIFVRNGTIWSHQAYLKASQVAVEDDFFGLTDGDFFGSSVAISGDTVVVGSPWEDGSATGVNGTVDELEKRAGAAYVFVRSGTTWSQQAYLKASQVTAWDHFGISVAVSGDTVVVGAEGEDGSATGVNGTADEDAGEAGAAYVFVRTGALWSQQAYLKASQVSAGDVFDGGDFFGYSVAVSGDTVVVGAEGEDGSAMGVNGTANELASRAGAAYIFVRNGGQWSQQDYLKASNTGAGDRFGSSVAVSGKTVVIGAIGESSNATGVGGNQADNSAISSGAAYVFATPLLVSPLLTAPGTKTNPGSVLTTLTPTFAWKAVTGATGYALTISNPETGQVAYSNESLGIVTSFPLPMDVLLPGFQYVWTIRTRNAGGLGVASAPFYFTIAENVPVPARLTALSPGTATQPGPVISTLTPTFLWKPLAGTLGHALDIMDMSNGTVVYSNASLGTAGAFILPAGNIQSGKAYSWTVRARNAVGWGASSRLFYFQTKSDVITLPPPSLISPGTASSPGPVIETLTPTFAWKAVTGATGYGLYIADVATNQLVYDRDDLPAATTLTLPSGVLEWGRAYRWNMRTNGSTGWGGFSPRYFFQTRSDYPRPSISTISPAVLLGSDAAQPVLIEGSGFRSGAQVLLSWTGKSDYLLPAAQTMLESGTRIRISIKTSKTADVWTAKVRNADLKVSDPVSFQVIAPAASSLTAPIASPPAGSYTQPVQVSLSQSQGAAIRYTLDGLPPDAFARLYAGVPLILGGVTPLTLRAQAVNGTSPPSLELSARYTFTLPVLPLPGSKTGNREAEGRSFYYKLTVPTGLAQLVVTTSDGIGDCDLYAARGRLPTTTDYDWSSRRPGTSDESLTLNSPVQGTYHVMLHGRTSYIGVTLAAAQTKTTGTTALPILSHDAGQHSAPISLTVACADSGAQIYYYFGKGDPITLGRVLLPGERIDITQNTTVSVRSWLQGKAPSAVVTAAFTILRASKEVVWEEVNADGISYRNSVFSVETAQASKDKPVEQEFFFDVPADPAPGTAVSELRFPVAVTFTKNSYAGTSEIFLNRGNTASAAKHLVKVEDLPAKDDMEIRESRATHVLGTVVGGKGFFLIPGTRYYGLVRASGSPEVNTTSGSHASAVAKLRITMELHECRLLKAPSDSSNVLAGQAKTWVIIHGRDSKAEHPDFSDMANVLHLHGPTEQISQVLRLDWSSMSKPWGDWLATSDQSVDEAMYTPGIGKRLSSVLSQWQMPNATTSLIGHSWGSYAAFEYGKHGKAARIVALDPATLGTGGYYPESLKVNFSSSATKTWAFFTDEGLYGSSMLTGTAHEAFVLQATPSAPWWHLPSHRAWSLPAHSAPVQLFTHLLRSNYEPSYAYAQTEVTAHFRLTRLDLQTDTAYWKSRAFWRRDQYRSNPNAKPFEAELDIMLDDRGFDEATPLILRYKDLISGNDMIVPTPP